MRSLAIIRATDILKLKSTLQEMNNVGLTLDGKPKEISPATTENILSGVVDPSDKEYEICALIPLNQEHSISQSKIKNIPSYSDVVVLDKSSEIFGYFAKMMSALPDLIIPSLQYGGFSKQISEKRERHSKVYLSAFVNRKVLVQTLSESNLTGILKNADSIGIFLEPSDDYSPVFITWHDIKKIIIPKEDKKQEP